MKDDPELQINESWSDDSSYSPKGRRIGSGISKFLRILLGVLLVLIFVFGILYFLSKLRTGGEPNVLQSRITAQEQTVARLEKQLLELQGKVNILGPDPALLQRLDAIAQKVEALEKQIQSIAELKARPPAPSRPAVSTEKQYHTVRKGETLYRIGKKYGISVEELRKLNNLSTDQPIRIGQKLLISPGR